MCVFAVSGAWRVIWLEIFTALEGRSCLAAGLTDFKVSFWRTQ